MSPLWAEGDMRAGERGKLAGGDFFIADCGALVVESR